MQKPVSEDFRKIISKVLELLKKNQDYQTAINYLEEIIPALDPVDDGLILWLALMYLENGDYKKAQENYLKIKAFYQAGYCEILQGNLEKANFYWEQCSNSEVSYWSKCLKTLVLGYIDYVPTILGIRNHLEADLGYLLRAKQLRFAENIINLADDLVQINLESYKFIGRSLLNNGYENLSVKYLIEGQKLLPNDPEVYYHLGQYSLLVGALEEAVNMFDHCILISPGYTPARDRLNEIKN